MSIELCPYSIRLTTGPIDQLQLLESGEICPICGAYLMLVPVQEGPCHSGQFVNRVLREHFWCSECADSYLRSDAARIVREIPL